MVKDRVGTGEGCLSEAFSGGEEVFGREVELEDGTDLVV